MAKINSTIPIIAAVIFFVSGILNNLGSEEPLMPVQYSKNPA